jgi:hypothetical protein
MTIRMHEVKATCSGSITTATAELGGTSLRAELDLPNPAYKYKASVQINSWAETNNNPTLRIQLQRATDAGATDWQNIASDVFSPAGSDAYQMAVANQQLANGDGIWDIAEGAAKLTIRAIVSTEGPDDPTATMPVFQGFISLIECF